MYFEIGYLLKLVPTFGAAHRVKLEKRVGLQKTQKTASSVPRPASLACLRYNMDLCFVYSVLLFALNTSTLMIVT
jgi:hypothetical protein